jgi:aspartyl-tRNA(Asn)/glutamyl-tRNA(Gln) amidotransferase subunit C
MTPPTARPCLDVRYVADLARLELTADEAECYAAQLQAVLEYVALLREPDVEGVEPTAHAAGLVNVLRPDEAAPSLDRERVLANAPAVAAGLYVRVPPVIEEET